MKSAGAIVIGLLIVVLASAQAGPEWTTLFDGSSLKDWNAIGDANWSLADRAVQADKGVGFLVSKNSYGDFQLKAEIWVDSDANSGIFIRCEDPKTVTGTNAYEVNIYDKRPDPAYRTGAIVNVAKPLVQINAGGRWNTLEITAQGSRLIVTLNGMRTVDAQDTMHAKGPVALQYGAGIVKFRNVQIKQL